MKRLVMILGLVLLLALAACDTMGPTTQEVLPTESYPGPAQESPAEVATTDGSSTGEQPEGETASAGADLQGVTWEWVSLLDSMGQTTATDPTRYTIIFNADGTANVQADCNTVVSSYVTDGVNLEILPGASTLAACPEGSQDQLFVNNLTSADSYTVQDGELFITTTGGTATMIFRPAPVAGSGDQPTGPSLTGTTWEWVSLTTPVETITVADPTRYTVLFNEDGTAAVGADCNSVTATYTAAEDSTISIMLGASTLMACPEDSQADVFTAGLSNAAIYSFVDGDLLLDMPASAGTLRFRPASAAEGTVSPDPELTGIFWEWVSTTTSAEEITATDPARYRIAFFTDGTAAITADCNVGNATYTVGEDGSMSIMLGISTLAFCENSQDTIFREGLAAAMAYSVEEAELFIDLAAEAGTMRFRNGGSAEESAPPPATADTLTGVTWEWVKTSTPVEEIVAVDQTRYNIVFNEDGTANIKADCNTGIATYTTGEGGAITITPGATTLAMCPEDSQATRYMADLSAAAIYFFQDGNLFIDLFASSGTMQFAPAASGEAEGGEPAKGEGSAAAPGELVGTTWRMDMITRPAGDITVNGPALYTVTFNADGTFNFQADCNVGGGTYTTGEGGALTLTLGPSTLAYCGPQSLDQVFLGGLTNAMNYRLENGGLQIDMLYESGTMMFSPAS